MPPEDEKTTVEVSDEAQEAPKKKSNMMLFVIIGAVVLLGGGGAFFFMSGGGDEAAQVTEDTHGQATEESQAGGHGEEAKSSHATKVGDAIMYAIDDIVVNPSGTGGSRFLSVSFGFELGNAKLAGEFEAREPLVRDALITILSSKSVAQLTDSREKEIMRYQVKKRLEQLLKTDQLVGVYYTDFVLQ